ncbi:MAG TPA: carboxypeptidase-like regulatory domain-containing protein, partial [Verrucomicrobiae bacterium]|nr:carboxypeptidase-like regulatory domain-containing protein [Verrucomicrobiae bacterium]
MKLPRAQLMSLSLGSAILLAFIPLAHAAVTEKSAERQVTIELMEWGVGKLVSGVEVTVSTNYDETFARQTSDADGRAVVKLPKQDLQDFWVRTSLDGWVPMSLYWNKSKYGDPQPDKIAIVMERATTMSGRVVDDAGQPVAGATVVLDVQKKYPGSTQQVSISNKFVKTDRDGKWSCDLVPAEFDSVTIGVFHHRYASTKNGEGYYPMDKFERLSALRDGTATLKLERGVLIEGVVRGSGGKPVAGAKVGYGRNRGGSNVIPEQQTDAEGRFAYGSKTGEAVAITVKAPGYAPEMKQLFVTQLPDKLVFDLKPAQVLSGRVVDEQGDPITGATIQMATWRDVQTLDTLVRSDADGRFTWKDAPADTIYASVYRAGYATNPKVAISAGSENKIVLHSPTVVKGTVLDAGTGELLPAFRVITGVDWGNGVSWDRPPADDAQSEGKAGKFERTFTYPYPNQAIRIEADGYLPAESEPFALDGKPKNLTFKLAKGEGIAGAVLGPDGNTAAGVQIVMPTGTSWVEVEDGRLTPMGYEVAQTVSDPFGFFLFSPQTDASLIVAINDSGFAKVTDAEFKTNAVVRLQTWGIVQGVVKTGTRPAANQAVTLLYPVGEGFDPQKPHVFGQNNATTDENGRFRFERVMPGQVSVSKKFKMNDWRSNYSSRATAVVAPGQTVDVNVGGNGRPVVGRIEIPADLKDGSWVIGEARLTTNVKMPKFDLPDEVEKMTAEERKAWYKKWQQSPEGKAFREAQRRAIEQRKNYAVQLQRDGSFRVDDVPEGSYVMNVSLAEPPKMRQCGPGDEIATVTHEFTMPAIPNGVSDEPLELAALLVTL